ncbi:unnamed protein product [Penicillium salamii]|nr:unnamed protein product [Penicillium salamii]
MFLFVIISIPTALVKNFAGLMVLRFLQGFFGSPCLASGGASIQDMYSLMSLPYAMMAWVSAAYCGPALGPLLSGFAVPVKGWRWSLYISIWASAPVLILMFLFLPETSTATILLRRAARLRKIHNNSRFMSQSEIDQRNMHVSDIAVDALIKPLEITIKDPAVLFVQIYTAIIYGIYYSFFEVFPLVYPVDYNMNLGQIGLVFLCIMVSCIVGIAIYVAYIHYWMNPRIRRLGFGAQESVFFPLCLLLSVLLSVSSFLLGLLAHLSIGSHLPLASPFTARRSSSSCNVSSFISRLATPSMRLVCSRQMISSAVLLLVEVCCLRIRCSGTWVWLGCQSSWWVECYWYHWYLAALLLWPQTSCFEQVCSFGVGGLLN